MKMILATLALAAVSTIAALAADVNAGKAVYDKSCKSCHGADGTANPAIAKMMKVDMRDLQSAEVQALSDKDMKKIVIDGKGKMKPTKTVSGTAAENVVAYVRSLKK